LQILIYSLTELLLVCACGVQESAQSGFAHAWETDWDEDELVDVIHFLLG
jgi:hypothetical protein